MWSPQSSKQECDVCSMIGIELGRIASTPSSSGEQHDDTTSNYVSIGVVHLKSVRHNAHRRFVD